MAKISLEYYTDRDHYSDGEIEDTILNIVENHIPISEIDSVTYPIIYHLSDVRANILNWYPFHPESTVLEIGSGCGALTCMLCSKVKEVVSVEISSKRANINYKRNQDIPNLSIYVGNLNDMQFQQKFDYIILTGVFEYAMTYTHSADPYSDFLKQMGNYLKKEGKLIIAIENKYGLKYFAGAPEDHTDEYFLGLNEYKGNGSVRTFGKNELVNLLKRSDFQYTQFYYPYPDYKFPKEIFTDITLQSNGYGREYCNLNGERFLLFNEERVARGLVNEGVMSVFTNSFLVIAAREDIEESERILYAKVNSDRLPKFQILTKIVEKEDKRYVVKEALNPEACQHIQNMILNCTPGCGKVQRVSSLEEKDRFVYEYINGDTLNNKIRTYMEENKIHMILEELEAFFHAAFEKAVLADYYNERFIAVFGEGNTGKPELCISDANIDLICDNVFHTEDGYRIIDCEWIFDFEIPVKFIIWRTINELYSKFSQLSELESIEDLLKRFEIEVPDIEVFRKWNYSFTREYVGSDKLEQYSLSKESIALNQLADNAFICKRLHSYLYLDYGKGFNEEDKICSVLQLTDSHFRVKFFISNHKGTIVNMRWDPLENRLIKMKVMKVDSDVKIKLNAQNNFGTEDGYDVFLSLDPRYTVEMEESGIKKLSLEGELEFINDNELQKVVDAFRNKLEALESDHLYDCENNEKLKEQIALLEQRVNELCQSLDVEKKRADDFDGISYIKKIIRLPKRKRKEKEHEEKTC